MTLQFSLASYNILADAYIRPDWYTHVPADVLCSSYRSPAIIKAIQRTEADIICLQEVEEKRFQAIQMALVDYVGVFSGKGHAKPDGCATFIRRGLFSQFQIIRHLYQDGQTQETYSGHLAQCIYLTYYDIQLGIINTHLKWDAPETPTSERWGYHQLMEIQRQIQDHPFVHWLVCGDFNIEPHDEILSMLNEMGLQRSAKQDFPTCYAKERLQTLDYIFSSSHVSCEGFQVPSISTANPIPSYEHPSDHLPITARFSILS